MTIMIKIIRSEKSWIESDAVEQLNKVAQLKGVIKAVGLPDLHPGKTPVGTSFVTKGVIYPHIAGNDIGCGMALFSTGVNRKKFKANRVTEELKKLEGIESLDIDHLIDKKNYQFKEKLGTLGGGNHFAEFQEIDKIYDEEAIRKIGIDKSSVLLLVHSGSRNYGEYILRKYIEKYSCQNGLDISSEAYYEYMHEHNDALEFARLNRELIAYRLLTYLDFKDFLKVLDSVHNSITSKEYNGETSFIHRKGAAPSDVGYIVVAGSRGSKSYIVEPTKDLFDYGYSISHGAGRKWSRSSSKERLERIYSKKDLRQNKLVYNVVCSDKNLIYEEAPEAYKSIERVIEDMLDEGMVRVIGVLNPLITYKG